MITGMVGTSEAAKILGITPQMVRLAVRAGKIKAYHPYKGSRKFVYRVQELMDGIRTAEDL